MNCEHQCSSECRREGCDCPCGEFHQPSFKSIETLVEQKAEVMGGLSGHQREVYRKMLEGKSVMETLDKQYWDKEAGADYRYGYDEDGHTKGDYKLNEY